MAKRYVPQHRRRSALPLLTVGMIVVGLVGTTLVLHTTGAVEIPFLAAKEPPPPPPDYSGLVRVPRSARNVSAYAAVERDDVWDARQQAISVVYLRPEDIQGGVVTDLGEILGRVLKRAKPAGYVFTEKDFYPKGTRPGPTAGIPPGKRAMRLKATDVPGLHGLNQGDRFDIVMTVPIEFEKPPLRSSRVDDGLDVHGPYAGVRQAEMTRSAQEVVRVKRKHAEVKTVVDGGVVVMPIHQRREISMKSSLLRGTEMQSAPVEELIIAVAPGEVAALNQALAVDAQLGVAMRSGRIDDVDEGKIPDLEARPEEASATTARVEDPTRVSLVEVIAGADKRLHAVPRGAAEDRSFSVGGPERRAP